MKPCPDCNHPVRARAQCISIRCVMRREVKMNHLGVPTIMQPHRDRINLLKAKT